MRSRLTREAAGAIGDDRRSQTLTRRHLDEALELPARTGVDVPRRPRRGRPTSASSRRTPGRCRTSPRPSPPSAGSRADGELVTWAEAARLAVSSHVRDLALLQPTCTPATAFPTIAELSDPPRRRDRRRLAGSRDARPTARRRSPTRPSSSSRRWTSASCSTRPASCSRSASGSGTARSIRAATTSSPPRPAWPASSRSPRATSTPDHWFRLGRALTPVGRGSALISWSGSMFEYLMPALVMRAPARSLLDQTYRLVVARQMSYAAERRRALGHLRIGLQRARPRADLPVLELRRARPRPEAGPQRGSRRRPVRDRAGRDDPARGRRPELRPARRRPAPAGRTASARRSTTRRGGCPKGASVAVVQQLHGPPPGDGAGGARQRPQRPGDGRALPRRPDRRGDRAAAPGADAARRAGGPAARRGGEERRRRARPRAADPASVHLAPRRDPADAPAVERPLRGDGDGRRIRLQPLGRPRGDPLARGRDPRLVGQLPLPARHAHRRGVVGRPPAERRRGRQLRGQLLGGSRRVLPSRRLDRDRPDRRRLGGARRRDPAGVADQSRLARSARSS